MEKKKHKTAIPIQRCYPEEYLVHQVTEHDWEMCSQPIQEFYLRFAKKAHMVLFSNACTMMCFEKKKNGEIKVRFIGRITETMEIAQEMDTLYIFLRFPPQCMFETLKGVVNQEIYLNLDLFQGEEAVRSAIEEMDQEKRFRMLMSLITKSKLHFWMSDIVNQFVTLSLSQREHLPVEEIIRQITYTPRYIRDVIREYTGISAKRLGDILRLQSIMLAQMQEDENAMDCVYDFGFYDQAHLNKSIKKLTGLTYSSFKRVFKDKNRSSQDEP